MKLEGLKNDLAKFRKEILDKHLELNLEKNTDNLMDTLCFSFSSIIADFIEENKDEECFYNQINGYEYLGNVDKYIDSVIYYWKTELPFSVGEPMEFFSTLDKF